MNIVTKIHEWRKIQGKHSANTSSRGREAHGRSDPEPSGLPRPAKSGGARNDDRVLTIQETIQRKTLGFVPTMGHLHAGHLSLCERSKLDNAITVVSIFVNPTQFNETSDFEKYPRTLEKDIELLSQANVDYLFLPECEEIYQDRDEMQIIENNMAKLLEGEHRPGHFNGMLTVVLKLLNIIGPKRAYFGEKDFQQLLLIKQMVNTFFMPIEVIDCPTIRDHDNLALSSRNSRLNPSQREKAALFPNLLKSDLDCMQIKEKLITLGFKVDYIVEKWNRRLGAVWVDDVRLIDNIEMPEGK